MPDNSDPNAIKPVPVTPMTGETPPTLPSMDSDVPPPPSPEPAGGAGPVGDLQGLGIPPVITPSKPKGRLSRRMVATILGVLVLVGGLGAGVVLVRQQQLFSQKARGNEPCNICSNGKCTKVASPPACTSIANECSNVGSACGTQPAPSPCRICRAGACASTHIDGCQSSLDTCSKDSQCGGGGGGGGIGSTCSLAGGTCVSTTAACTEGNAGQMNCGSGQVCGKGTCRLPDPANPNSCTGQGGTCVQSNSTCTGDIKGQMDCASGKVCGFGTCRLPSGGGTTCSGTNALVDTAGQCVYDNNVCPAVSTSNGQYCYNVKAEWGYKLKSECSTCPQVLDITSTNPAPGGYCLNVNKDCSSSFPGPQPGIFCQNSPDSKCATSVVTPGGPTAQCLAVQAFDSNWTLLTSDKLSGLKVGDVVRFTIGATATEGVNDKAKFKINGVDRSEVTGKRPGTEEFFDEYTVPAGVTTFSVGAQMHNSVLGWF